MKLSKRHFVMGVASAAALLGMTASASDYRQEFIDIVAPSAQELAGANDLYPSVMIAQAIHESDYGQAGLGSAPNHNLFGIKGDYYGDSVYVETWEDDGYGNSYTIMDNFRSYPSYYESLADYTNVLGQPWFSGAWRSNTTSHYDATEALEGTYATDTSYAEKLNSIIAQHELTYYDGYGGELVWNDYRGQMTPQSVLDADINWASLTSQ